MITSIIDNKVYYKIFDRNHKNSTLIYTKFKFTDKTKLTEIAENRRLVIQALQAQNIFTLKQVHGTNVVIVDDSTDYMAEPEADGLITNQSDIALGILTADCVPVLFSCSTGDVIGAAHCGWKSAKSGIITEMATKMRNNGAKSIKAVIGPSIQQSSYEVDEKYYQSFIDDSKLNEVFFTSSISVGHYMFDLPSYVRQKLIDENIEPVKHINEDTYSMQYKYPSHRRSSHNGKQYSQTILSAIIKK
jgi:hypothetical protein